MSTHALSVSITGQEGGKDAVGSVTNFSNNTKKKLDKGRGTPKLMSLQ